MFLLFKMSNHPLKTIYHDNLFCPSAIESFFFFFLLTVYWKLRDFKLDKLSRIYPLQYPAIENIIFKELISNMTLMNNLK